MVRFILVFVLLLLSLLNVFPAPLNLLWYVSILTTEFCWIFFAATILLMLVRFGSRRYESITLIAGSVALCLFLLPVAFAYRLSAPLRSQFESVFRQVPASNTFPFKLSRMITGIGATQLEPRSMTFSEKDSLDLDWYPSQVAGNRPCVIVIHGGSWAGGGKKQLPELNTYLAMEGYHVVSINYRLAPGHPYPAAIEDVGKAIRYLKTNAGKMHIASGNFVLLGRSAGGQIALDAAYSLRDVAVRGVISYYGPTDMVWGYANPANPLVLDSKKVMEDYLGGTYAQVPLNYIKSSATRTATSQSVPTLIIQGKNDPLVAYDHSNRLDTVLNREHVSHVMLQMPWATHGCDYTLNGPAGQLCTYATVRFLEDVFVVNEVRFR